MKSIDIELKQAIKEAVKKAFDIELEENNIVIISSYSGYLYYLLLSNHKRKRPYWKFRSLYRGPYLFYEYPWNRPKGDRRSSYFCSYFFQRTTSSCIHWYRGSRFRVHCIKLAGYCFYFTAESGSGFYFSFQYHFR